MNVRYVVTATIHDKCDLDEYLNWLKNGHVQAVVAAGGISAEVVVLESNETLVESSYLFPTREVLQAYFDGPALELREEGKRKYIDTIGTVAFAC